MRESLKNLSAYDPQSGRGLPLHRNTNLWGTNPIAHDLPYWIEQMDLSDYPSVDSKGLREELALYHDLSPDHFLIGNGSSEVVDIACKASLEPGETIACPSPSFSMYQRIAIANSLQFEAVSLNDNFQIDSSSMLASKPNAIILCTPNNPTGNAFDELEIERILESEKLVIIDEAYAEFGDQNWLSVVDEHSNLLVCRTFSIAFGLAGIRVGYATGNPTLISQLDRVRAPYNVNAICQIIATMALRNETFVEGYIELIREQRPIWSQWLASVGFKIWPSDANFLLASVPENLSRDQLVTDLENAGVLLMTPSQSSLENQVRITIGTEQELRVLQQAVNDTLG